MYKLFCRVYQGVMYLACFLLPWREPKLLVGNDAVARLAQTIKDRGVKKVLVVTDKGLTSCGLPQPIMQALTDGGVEYALFDDVVPNPTIDCIEQARKTYLEQGCDGILAIGGGSPMDCAKACGARIARPNKSVQQMKGLLKIGKKLPLLIAIPTTSGTGSETTLAAVVTDSATHHKYALNDPCLIPHVAVLDPSLTVGLPQHVTSTTGMDALCHAVEAYIGRANTKITKKNAVEAVKLVFDNLYDAYCDGSNLQARNNMQIASYKAGLAFTRAYVGAVHATAHTLGGMYHVPHGLANAVIMPYVFRAFGKSAHKRLAQLADEVNVALPTDSTAQKAEKFICAIEQLNEKMGLPKHFEQIDEKDYDQLATFACQEANPLYPLPKILLKKDYVEIFKQLKG